MAEPTAQEPKNDGLSTSTPTPTAPVKTEDNSEVERLKAELQAQMRANQVANEKLKAKEEAEAEAKRKQLEENEEWKSLAEQEKAKREALEAEREAETRTKELKEATDSVFKDFPAEVIEIAQETGLTLNDVTDEAKETLKAKLEKIQTKVVTNTKVTPNNGQPAPINPNRDELLERMKYGDREAREKVISEIPGVKAMRKMAGFE